MCIRLASLWQRAQSFGTAVRAGLPMACRTLQDWEQALETYMSDENARREAGQKGLACAQAFHSEEKLQAQWDALFESLLAESKA